MRESASLAQIIPGCFCLILWSSFITHHVLLVPHARPLSQGDLALRILRELSSDLRGVQT